MHRHAQWLTLAALTLVALSGARDVPGSERSVVRTHPRASSAELLPGIIVKLRPARTAASSSEDRLKALAIRHQLTLYQYRSITRDIYVLKLSYPTGSALETQLELLRADPEVEYAEHDARRYAHSTPDDTLYAEQWYFQANASSTPSAVNLASAWNTTVGSATLIIADIDTGVRFDHPDLLSTSAGGRLLPGYCFISDPFVANNSSCPGADASDPGDWVTSSDLSQPECSGLSTSYSSWHGTRVAGVLGAITNNALGIAGATWQGSILPVRALGTCGGIDSDIISGILWAAGIEVSGAPANPNPARVINLSLGGTGSCPQSYQDSIDQVIALGVLVVASAGNEGGPVDAPANCAGVAGVAGLRQAGTKVGYSSLGPQIALGAPAGNCVNSGAEEPCLYSIITTTNLGTEGPDVNDYTGMYYCDPTTGSFPGCQISGNQYRTENLGTSFSAPIVSGIGALMTTVNPSLSPCRLIARLQEGALAYPQTSVGENPQPPMCHVPANSNDIQDSECICTQDGQTCGAGMTNAPGALTAALRPVAAIAVPASVTAGQTVTLDASGSAAASSRTLSYAWTQVSGVALTIGSASTSKATVKLPSCGVATLRLTVTDNAGAQDAATAVVGPQSVNTAAPATAQPTTSCSSALAVEVGVCPASASAQANGGTETFSATLANTSTSTVTWEVNGIVGGNSTVGTITTAGVYTAPSQVPSPATITVSAVSTADATAMASSRLTVTSPPSSGGGGSIDWLSLTSLAGIYATRFIYLATLRRRTVETLKTLSSQRSNGSTGSTTAGSLSRSETFSPAELEHPMDARGCLRSDSHAKVLLGNRSVLQLFA